MKKSKNVRLFTFIMACVLLNSIFIEGIFIPKKTNAAEFQYKTANCYTTTSGTKNCTNASSLSGYGSNFTFSQIHTIQQQSTYFKYVTGKFNFTIKKGNPYTGNVWADLKTSYGTGARERYASLERKFLRGYSSFTFDMRSVPSYYIVSGSNKGYAGQSTVEIVSDLLEAGADTAVTYQFITYPRKY